MLSSIRATAGSVAIFVVLHFTTVLFTGHVIKADWMGTSGMSRASPQALSQSGNRGQYDGEGRKERRQTGVFLRRTRWGYRCSWLHFLSRPVSPHVRINGC